MQQDSRISLKKEIFRWFVLSEKNTLYPIMSKNNINKSLRIIASCRRQIYICITNTRRRRGQLYRYKCIYECGYMWMAYFGDLSRSLTESRKIDTVGHDARNGIWTIENKTKGKLKHTPTNVYTHTCWWLPRYYEEQRTSETGGYIWRINKL